MNKNHEFTASGTRGPHTNNMRIVQRWPDFSMHGERRARYARCEFISSDLNCEVLKANLIKVGTGRRLEEYYIDNRYLKIQCYLRQV